MVSEPPGKRSPERVAGSSPVPTALAKVSKPKANLERFTDASMNSGIGSRFALRSLTAPVWCNGITAPS